MSQEHQIIFNTCPDHDTAKQVAETLVARGLAACINILPGVESVYRWQEQVECSQEYLLAIKTRADAYSAVEQAILELHPYELPEIVAVPLANGLPAYLAWISDNSSTTGKPD